MFCPYCGNEVENDAKFCSSCGKQLRQNRAKSPANPAKPAANPPQIVRAKKRPKKPLSIVLAVLGIAVVTLFVGILRLNALKLKLPDPETFFGTYGEVEAYDDDRAFKLYFDSDPTEAFYAYIELVEEIKGLDPYIGSLEERSDKLVYIYRGNTGFIVDLCESMYLGHFPRLYTENLGLQDNGQYAVWVAVYGKNKIVKTDERASESGGVVEPDEDEAETAQRGEKDEKEETSEKNENTDKNEAKVDENKVKEPKKGVPTLPDPYAFFGSAVPNEEWEIENGYHISWPLEIDNGYIAAYEYVDLLLYDPRFSFEVVEYIDNSAVWLISEKYLLKYTGDGDVTPASGRYYSNGYVDYTEDIFISIQKNAKNNNTGFCIEYSKDFELTDLGDRSSVADKLSPGKNNNSDDFNDSDSDNPFSGEDCIYCDDGDCLTCDGYGKVRKYAGAGEYVETTCDDCDGNRDCWHCHGSGKRS